MSESNLNNAREIDAAWNQHFNNMLISGGAHPAEAAESMLRIATLIAESMLGPRKTAATLVLAAMFFTQRIRTNNVDDEKKSEVLH